jgi:shikimate kinase
MHSLRKNYQKQKQHMHKHKHQPKLQQKEAKQRLEDNRQPIYQSTHQQLQQLHRQHSQQT